MTEAGLDQQKAALRKEMRRRRAEAVKEKGQAAEAILQAFQKGPALPKGLCVSGYWPIKTEADPRALLTYLHEKGHPICLPVVPGAEQPLIFRAWKPGDDLTEADFGTFIPSEDKDLMEPDALLVPLLAFDRLGYRLGYGGGFYDRTLDLLRPKGPRLAIGLAFSDQEVEAVPIGQFDQKLDLMITDQEVIAFGAEL